MRKKKLPPLTVIAGNALDKLKDLPENSIHCCVTSPPYWGLRDYGVPPSVWGGNPECEHEWEPQRYYTERLAGKSSNNAFQVPGGANAERVKEGRWREDSFCRQCGAWLGCLGLEPTPELFIEHTVSIFREVYRVLRKDGTLWVNMGDCYMANPKSDFGDPKYPRGRDRIDNPNRKRVAGLKQKDLVGQPWMLAFALRADGWYLRKDIIWDKKNPMPESVRDRPSNAHEYLFLLSKSPKYYYDAEAIKEKVSGGAHHRGGGVNPKAAKITGKTSRMFKTHCGGQPKPRQNESFSAAVRCLVEYRNKRSIWTVGSYSYGESHFATYPPDLVKPCILAGSPVGGVVLDPFAGSGTTGEVALELGRKAVLIELNPEYQKLIQKRTFITPGLPL